MAQLDLATKLAIDRTRVAYDRTMMAWIRTATSLISFGFGIYKFFQLDMRGDARDHHPIGPREFALLMVAAGLISLLLGTVDHLKNMQSLRKQDSDLPRSRTGVLAAVLSTVGIVALIAVAFRQ